MTNKSYSREALITLRNCVFSGGELDGVRFVRCIPLGEDRLAIALRVVGEIGEAGVCLSNNPDFGGDYVRVECSTETYRLICYMKS